MAMTIAGIVLSQPEIPTKPSMRCPRTTSSTESATVSRLMSEAFMPSVPIAIPSVTVIELNSIGVPPAARTPSFTFSAIFRWFQLHGVISIQQCATPTSGFFKSSSVKPIALKNARAAARSGPSRMVRLLWRGWDVMGWSPLPALGRHTSSGHAAPPRPAARRSRGSRGRRPPRSRSPSWPRPAFDHQVGLALLNDLAALVEHGPLHGDEAAVGLRGLLFPGDLRAQFDRVADLDRSLEFPPEPDERERRVRLGSAREQARLDRQPEEAVGDPLAEDRLLHELGVGVEHVVVAGQPREDHDVRLGDGPSRRLVLLAQLDVVEIPPQIGHGSSKNSTGPLLDTRWMAPYSPTKGGVCATLR